MESMNVALGGRSGQATIETPQFIPETIGFFLRHFIARGNARIRAGACVIEKYWWMLLVTKQQLVRFL